MIIPVLILFLMNKGLDLFQVGLCLSTFSFMVFLFELPTGGLADQIGRKTVYLISSSVSICAAFVLLILSDNILFLFLGMGLKGISRSLSTGTIEAWFVDRFRMVSPTGDLQKAFAIVGIFVPLGLGIGAFVGGILPMASTSIGWERYSLNLVIMLAIDAWTAIFTIILISERSYKFDKRIWNSFQNLPRVLGDAFQFGFHNRSIFLLMSAYLIWGFSVMSIENLWQPRLKWILGSEEQSWIFGLLSSGYFMAAAAGNIIITPICRLFKNQYALILVIFRFTMGTSFILLTLQTRIWGFSFMYIFMFLQNGFIKSPHQSLFHQLVPDEKRSTMISLESLFISVGAISGNVVLGWLANIRSIPFAWTIAGVAFCSSSIIYLMFMRVENTTNKNNCFRPN